MLDAQMRSDRQRCPFAPTVHFLSYRVCSGFMRISKFSFSSRIFVQFPSHLTEIKLRAARLGKPATFFFIKSVFNVKIKRLKQTQLSFLSSRKFHLSHQLLGRITVDSKQKVRALNAHTPFPNCVDENVKFSAVRDSLSLDVVELS